LSAAVSGKMDASDSERLTLLSSRPVDGMKAELKYDKVAQEQADDEDSHAPKPRSENGSKSVCEEHWGRCPKRAAGDSSFTNLGGLMLQPFAVALKIFMVERCLTAYDSTADID
jgi:hypothetical protein